MRDELLQTLMVGMACAVGGCTAADPAAPLSVESGGSGVATAGNRASGGAGTGNTGASTGGATGGTAPASGGTMGVATGGMSALGGGGGHGGSVGVSSGGSSGAVSALGGTGAGLGGAGASTGGVSAVGGSGAGLGGKAGASMGGMTAVGGGGAGLGGGSASGGAGPGGMAGAAGASDPPCPPSTPLTGGKQYCGSSGDGTADGPYTYNLWSDGKGMGCMTVYGVDAAFKSTWMNVGDWIGRVGLSYDKSKTYSQIGTFSSDFAYTMTDITTGGFGNIGIYGWTVNDLHEFYIAENWLGKKPNFTKVGTFTIDGEGTYDVMTNQQKNQPNITGTNQDFVQYWSVRSSPRQCGHISISKHFDEWASLNLPLGKMEEVRILVEAQNNSGTLDFTQATVVVK